MDRLWSIPNTLNVLTNLLFGWAGAAGIGCLVFLHHLQRRTRLDQ